MLTNRKKLKNRKQKVKLLLGFFITILVIGGVLGYIIYNLFVSRSSYISPLAQGSYVASQDEGETHVIENQLREQKIEYVSVKLSTDGYTIRLKDDGVVIISLQKDINKQISSLQFIHSRLTMEGRTFLRLDLRYDKPIIVFR